MSEDDPNVVDLTKYKTTSREKLIANTRERFYKNLSKKLAWVQADLGIISPEEVKAAEEHENKGQFYERLY